MLVRHFPAARRHSSKQAWSFSFLQARDHLVGLGAGCKEGLDAPVYARSPTWSPNRRLNMVQVRMKICKKNTAEPPLEPMLPLPMCF